MNGPFFGITDGDARAVSDRLQLVPDGQPQADSFAGMGPLLEEDDETLFKTVDGLVQRQEILALNHLAQDTHWTWVKMGYPWSILEKDPLRSSYRQYNPYGTAPVSIQAIPNKAWDLVNKTTEALLVDFPEIECEPGDDSEQAEAACDLGDRFLTQDASEQGTNDAPLFWDRVQRSLTCASAYLECWTDPTGGGYVPLQIPAHPEAESPAQPLLGPDGTTTESPIMRYVTEVGPDGQPTEQSQFTDDPTQAAPQWQPKLRAAKWQREHIRVYPETASVDQAQKVIVLGYCTLDEAKRRWPAVAALSPADLTKLCDWTPTRYQVLLPLFLRSRWQLTDGRDKNKQGSSDERVMFYYHVFAKASPDHKKGADVVVTGARDRWVIDRKLLSKDVEVPQADGTSRKETRCLEIPVVQITPRGDPDDQDPSGRAYIELVAGAIENNAHLALSASEVIDKNLHPESYSSSTSPITGQQVEQSRATGNKIPLIRPEDKPTWGPVIAFEQAFFNFYELSDQAINSMGSSERAAKGQENATEKSGIAIQLATANNNVSLGGMNHAINNAYARWNRIKLERMMTDYTTQQQIAFVGEDGIFKSQAFDAMDFALIGKVSIKAGSGGLNTPDQKIQNALGLAQSGIVSEDEAKEISRPAFSKKLGLPASPHEQRAERQIAAFLLGPPEPAEAQPGQPPAPTWEEQWQKYQEDQQAFDANQQQAQQNAQHTATPPGLLAPPPQQPIQTALKPPVMPPTAFTPPLPTDELPEIAAMRSRKLARMIDSAKFESFSGEWQDSAFREFDRMQKVLAAVQAPPPQAGPKGPPAPPPKTGTPPTQPTQPHPVP